MSFEQNVVTISMVTAADLSAKQFYLGVVNSSGLLALASAAGQEVDGVIYDNGGTSGRVTSLAVGGTVQVILGDTVTAGDKLTTNASGKAVLATTAITNTSDGGSATDPLIGSYVFGKALASGVVGDIIPVAFAKSGAVPTTAA
jgi:hypothetical protein